MSEQETFIKADLELKKVIDKIKDEQWSMEMPEDFPQFGKKTYSLREIVEYHAYDEAWIPDMMAGKTMKEVNKDKFGNPFDNDLLGNNPKENYAELSQKAITAVRKLSGDQLETRTVHYTYGDFSAREALWHAILFRAMRTYDLAKAIGADSRLPEELVHAVWEIVEPHAEEWREIGVFPPEVKVPDNAPLHDRLLGLSGRQP